MYIFDIVFVSGGLSCVHDFLVFFFFLFSFKDTERCMVKSFTDINKAISHLPLYLIFMCKETIL